MNAFQFNINTLTQVGVFYEKKLNRLHIKTLFDLLTYAPRLYEVRKKSGSMRDLIPGEKTMITGRVIDARIQERRVRMLLVTLADDEGLLTLRFFRFYPGQVKQFAVCKKLCVFGEVRQVGSIFEMVHPEFQFVEDNQSLPLPAFTVYPLSEGLTQARLRLFIENAFKVIKSHPCAENLPPEVVEQFSLMGFYEALEYIHFPEESAAFDELNAHRHPAQLRLIFEELLAHRLALKQPSDAPLVAQALQVDHELISRFISALPFTLTPGQEQAVTEIFEDLQKPVPMQRLLQGDVGSGKTLVAFLSALAVMKAGQQVVLMAPTEILAEQLFQKAREVFQDFGISIVSLLGKLTAKNKRDAYQQIESGAAQFIIGTHAVIQAKVVFDEVGLIIIDEQHRFGVGQRLKLQEKSGGEQHAPHQLIMSATPIPRTLAMTLYADLAISNITELPPGRRPIETVLIRDTRRDEIIERLKNACQQGEQVYWICPLIEESEKLELEAAAATCERLSQELPGASIALLHGRMKGPEKSSVMDAFKAGKIQVLVATTVVEVGVDVPNASIMIIENPERMGLSQLHQLRGRVGRGHKQSFCVLLYHPPLSATAMARLQTLRQSQNGFDLAEKDLELRGAGEFLGTRQTGGIEFRFASLTRDRELLKHVHEAAEVMRVKYAEASQKLIQKWFASGLEFIKV